MLDTTTAKGTRTLFTRRRRDAVAGESRFSGYDELIDGRETGRVVLSWQVRDGEAVYHYEGEALMDWGKTPKAFVAEPVGNPIAGEAPAPSIVGIDPQTLATRFIISFDSIYGPHEIAVERIEDISPQRQAIERKFGDDLEAKNWSVREERFLVREMAWPGLERQTPEPG